MVTGLSSKTVSDICKHCFRKMLWMECSDQKWIRGEEVGTGSAGHKFPKGRGWRGGLSFKTELTEFC